MTLTPLDLLAIAGINLFFAWGASYATAQNVNNMLGTLWRKLEVRDAVRDSRR